MPESPDPTPSPGSWQRLALGVIAGAALGAALSWYADQARQADLAEGEHAPSVKTGDMVSLGIETLGLVRTLLRLLKRL